MLIFHLLKSRFGAFIAGLLFGIGSRKVTNMRLPRKDAPKTEAKRELEKVAEHLANTFKVLYNSRPKSQN